MQDLHQHVVFTLEDCSGPRWHGLAARASEPRQQAVSLSNVDGSGQERCADDAYDGAYLYIRTVARVLIEAALRQARPGNTFARKNRARYPPQRWVMLA